MTTGMGRKRGARGAAVDMSEDDENLEIIYAEDEGDTDEPESVDFTDDGGEPEPAPQIEPVQENEAFAILKREKDVADAALVVERAKSRDLETRVAAADGDLDATSAAVLKHASITARGEVKAAQVAFARAMAAQDFDAAGDAQALISEKMIEAREYEAASLQHEQDVTARRAAPKSTPQPEPVAEQDDDAKIRASLTPKSGDWAVKHKATLFKSQAAWSSAIAAHHKAIEAGIEMDSPEYFTFLEGDLGMKEPQTVQKTTPAKPVRRAPPVAAAPVNKGGTTAAGGSVTLSKGERDAAARMGMTVTRYAANKKRALDAANDPDYNGPKYSQHNPAVGGRR